MVRDEHGRITQVNQSFCDLFGITTPTGQLVGTSAAKLAKHWSRPPSRTRLNSCAGRPGCTRSAGPPRASSSAARTGGPSRGTTGRCSPKVTTGAICGCSGIYRSARRWRSSGTGCCGPSWPPGTRRSRRSSGLPSRTVKLQELDEAKSEFLATMSHELRTPLTSIVSFVELVLDAEQQLAADTPRIAAHHPQERGAAAAPGRRPADAEPGGGRGAVAGPRRGRRFPS